MVRQPTDDYEQIRKFVLENGGRSFSLADILSATSVRKDVIGVFLLRNFRRGLLTRVTQKRPFIYKQVKDRRIPLRKSKGEVAQVVWAVLVVMFPKYTTIQRIARLASSASKKNITRNNVRVVVQRWHRNGFVEKEEKAYRKKKEVSKRPPAVS